MNQFTGKFPCPLSPSGYCRRGGNKAYNYGGVSGTASYCREAKRWVYGRFDYEPITCPLANTGDGIGGAI